MTAAAALDLAFDIEVAGTAWEEIDEPTRAYLLDRARDDAEREAVPERTALFPGLGKVVAIGLWDVAADRGSLLLEGAPTAGFAPFERVPGAVVQRGSEADLLRAFWARVAPNGAVRTRLISFHGRAYDLPMLGIRSAMAGIKPSLAFDRRAEPRDGHVDLVDVLTFGGALRERYRLDYWCRRFGVESPKSGLDGSQVARAYRDGGIEDIGAYCLRDARATAALYRRLAGTLLD